MRLLVAEMLLPIFMINILSILDFHTAFKLFADEAEYKLNTKSHKSDICILLSRLFLINRCNNKLWILIVTCPLKIYNLQYIISSLSLEIYQSNSSPRA